MQIESIVSAVNTSRVNLMVSRDPVLSVLARTCGITAQQCAADDAVVSVESPLYHVSESRQAIHVDPRWVAVLPDATRGTILDRVLQTILLHASESPETLAALVAQAAREAQQQSGEGSDDGKGSKGDGSGKRSNGSKGDGSSKGSNGSSGSNDGSDADGNGCSEGNRGSNGDSGDSSSSGSGVSGGPNASGYYDDAEEQPVKGLHLDQQQRMALGDAMASGRIAGYGAATAPTSIQRVKVAFESKREIESLLGSLERKDEADPTRMLPNRRFPGGCGWRPRHNPKLLVALDVSGSMSEAHLRNGVSGVEKLARDLPYRIDVIRFNSAVLGRPIEARAFLRAPFESGGGTSFDAIQRYADDSGYEALIMVTDGEDTMVPRDSGILRRNVRTLVALVPGSSEASQESIESQGYKVVRMRN